MPWQSPPITPLDRTLETDLRAKVDGKAKPPGSLGRLEDLAVRLGLILGTTEPRIGDVELILFAGDHGLVAEGVSSYPAAVTAAMVETLVAGRGSANAVAGTVGARVTVVDAGVAADLPADPRRIDAKIRRGTRNAAQEAALAPDEVAQALVAGARIATEAIGRGAEAIALGEMGIGNTAAAALLTHRLLPAPLVECIGVGAGHDSAGFARKTAALERAAARTEAKDPLDVLAEFGGCEIVMMAGAILGAASSNRPAIVDGFIASAAALAAIRLAPAAADRCIFAHRSAERGHALLLERLGAEPLLDLGMRLGEGTGALLAVPLLRAACSLLTDVADLSDVLARAT